MKEKKFLNDICRAVGHEFEFGTTPCTRCGLYQYAETLQNQLSVKFIGMKKTYTLSQEIFYAASLILQEAWARGELRHYKNLSIEADTISNGYVLSFLAQPGSELEYTHHQMRIPSVLGL